MKKALFVESISDISAIYYALLQCGYEFYFMGRDAKHTEALSAFAGDENGTDFFRQTRQNTCEVYPYWPRAAILETASFCLDADNGRFQDFDALYEGIMSAGNLSEEERDRTLWTWIETFPEEIEDVQRSEGFARYMKWEKEWISVQNRRYAAELQRVQRILEGCVSRYESPVKDIRIVLNPIKCVYSADYQLVGEQFIYVSGSFSAENVIHEFLHHVVHPYVQRQRSKVIGRKVIYTGLDESYYLDGSAVGMLNAFEEYAVRRLTENVLAEEYPICMEEYLKSLFLEAQ